MDELAVDDDHVVRFDGRVFEVFAPGASHRYLIERLRVDIANPDRKGRVSVNIGDSRLTTSGPVLIITQQQADGLRAFVVRAQAAIPTPQS